MSIDNNISSGKNILVEGANTAVLDIDFGKIMSTRTVQVPAGVLG